MDDDKEKKCQEAMKSITKCHKYIFYDKNFYSCVVEDLKKYIKYCEPGSESETQKENN